MPVAPFPLPLICVISGDWILAKSDPTDHALAAIASILDHPETPPAPERAASEERPAAARPMEADGYQKLGPGPMAAIRFKWRVRRAEDGGFYVDETIGENSTAIVTGPMPADAAIKLVDERESEALRRFEALRSEMAGRGAAASLVRKAGGET